MTAAAQNMKAENDPAISLEIRDFLKTLNSGNGKPIEELSPADARAVLINAQNSVEYNYSDVEETEMMVVQDGLEVKVDIMKPLGAQQNSAGFIFIHGGGWVLGDYQTHRRLIRDLVVASGAVALFPNYSPSPEARYPQAINEIYAVTKWINTKGKQIGVNGTNLAIVGNSAGGNMAAAVALMAKEKKGPQLKLLVLLWPVTDSNFETESYKAFAEKRFLTRKMMIWFWDNYAPDTAKRNEIYAAPLKASLQQLKGLPPVIIQTAENDVLRDEGEAFARKLDEAGVPVTVTRFVGLIHDFGLLNPLSELPAVKAALLQAAASIKKELRA